MLNPNKKPHIIDDRPKGRQGIAEMIDRMMNTKENGEPEIKENINESKTTA